MSEFTCLYRHYDEDGNLLYVGISANPFNRLVQHKYGSKWFNDVVSIQIERHPSKFLALQAERIAIDRENPKYNIHRKSNRKSNSTASSQDEITDATRCCFNCCHWNDGECFGHSKSILIGKGGYCDSFSFPSHSKFTNDQMLQIISIFKEPMLGVDERIRHHARVKAVQAVIPGFNQAVWYRDDFQKQLKNAKEKGFE